MWSRIRWLTLFVPAAGLLFYFFTYPFARFIFIPLSILLGTAGFLSPPLGIGLFIAMSLATLQVPIILGLPFFFGPEPCFLALCAGASLRFLRTGMSLRLSRLILVPLTVYGFAVAISAGLVWISLLDLPDQWPFILSLDALSKIYFWRWDNPFHFLRIGLLYFEGIAAFLIGIAACRQDYLKTTAMVTLSFLFAGLVLMGYSTVELLFRGKQITVYPGFGPVFTDRNAYAAFWVLYTPLVLTLAINTKGLIRLASSLLTIGSALFCILSLSFTGIAGLAVGGTLAIVLTRPRWPSYLVKPSFYWDHRRALSFVAAVTILLPLLGWMAAERLGLMEPIMERVTIYREKGLLTGVFEERAVPWSVAAAMFLDKPVLGVGPGEYYRLYQVYKQRFSDLPEFEYQKENAHNYFLQLAGETGLVGLGGFLAVLISLLYFGCRGCLPSLRSSASSNRTGTSAVGKQPETERSPPGAPETMPRRLDRALKWIPTSDTGPAYLAALGGLTVLSLAQHPMLRVEFQLFFWFFCALLAAPMVRRSDKGSARFFGGILAVMVFVAALIQWNVYPPTDRTRFQYGFRPQIKQENRDFRLTERLAFYRGPVDRTLSLRLKRADDSTAQQVRISVNGIEQRIQLATPQWCDVPLSQRPSVRIDLGIESFPAFPRGFVDSWGAGVRVALTGVALK